MKDEVNPENDVVKTLNILRDKRNLMVFVGGSYEKDKTILNALKETIKKVELIPIIAEEVYKNLNPDEIHGESLRLLHNCSFAVIDITNPSGQLMELERARDYGVVTFVPYSSQHPSKMPTTLSKVMESWGLGYLFKYEHIEGLEKFVKSMLHINHLKGMTSEEIIRAIVGTETKKLLLITSIGVLKPEEHARAEIKNLLNKIGRKIIITGWDYKTRWKEASNYCVDAIVSENCILHTKSNSEFNKTKDYCDEGTLRLVKFANKQVLYAIQDYIKEKHLKSVVFFSQANEKSICYYLNPPKTIREKLERYKEEKPYTINNFAEKVKSEYGCTGTITGNKIEYAKPRDTQAEEALLYTIEKINARYRTFHPYSINVEENKLFVDLEPLNSYKEFSYRDIENIVEITLAKIKMENYYEQLYKKVQPQKDVCIDIFCKSKDEIFVPLLNNMINDDKDTLVVYLSKGTESDIPMIFSGYSSEYNFIAVGTDDVSDRLKRAGVIPLGESIAEVIRKILDFSSNNAFIEQN